MIIAVDYDGTLEIDGHMNRSLLTGLKRAQKNGDVVILWTCREGRDLMEAITRLRSVGFAPNAVNNNVPEGIKRMGYNSRKILADVYIDDKSSK